MINPFSWFEQASQDQSIYYLYKLFGSVNGLLCDPANCKDTSGISLNLLGTMFKAFNGVILAVGALIVVYVTVVGVIKTAQEGEFMGKNWNSLWVPLRVVLGIGMLVPTASGYSGIQIIMMWVIIQGIGAADFMWNTALLAVKVIGNPYGSVTIPSAQVDQTMHTLFQSLSCQETARINSNNPLTAYVDPNAANDTSTKGKVSLKGDYFCNSNPGDAFCQTPVQTNFGLNPIMIPFGPGQFGQCGKMALCNKDESCADDSNSIKCVACTQEIAAVNSIIALMQPIAAAFAKADYEYRDFFANSYNQPADGSHWTWIYNYCQAQSKPIVPCQVKDANGGSFPKPTILKDAQGPSSDAVQLYWHYYPDLEPNLKTAGNTDFVGASVKEYIGLLQKAVDEIIDNSQNTDKGGPQEDISKQGWILAGKYYFAIAQTNKDNLSEAMPKLEFSGMDPQESDMVSFRNNYSAAATLMRVAAGQTTSALPSSMSGVTQATAGATNSLTQIATQFTVASGSSALANTNPLADISRIGITMLVAAELIFVAFITTTVILTLLGNLSIFILGNGVDNPVGPSTNTLYLLIVPAVFGLLTWLITMGGLLGIYIPMIPYVIFTIGAIGWLISTIEAMIAGPLVALGVLSPSGQHEVLGKAEPALMLLFNIFLRPTLMIFGMMAAMVLAPVVVIMINAGFWGVAQQISPGWFIDPIEIVLYITAYVLFLLTALNKTFSVIHVVPERGMRWVGGQGEQYGEAEALGEQKRGMEAGSGAAAGAVAGVRQSEKAGQGGAESAKVANEAAAERKASKGKITPGGGG